MAGKFFSLSIILLLILTSAQGSDTIFEPEIVGTIRPKYEYSTNTDEHRFQLRNARFSVQGKFSEIVSYKAEIDLSDEGVTKMLDAYVRFQTKEWYKFTIGQQKIPFSTDNLRSPHQLYFANRSFIGKQLTSGLRDVGAMLELINKETLPFNFFAGVYNGTGLYNQKSWRKTNELSYVTRLELKPADFWGLSLNFNSIQPVNIRMNLHNAGVFLNIQNFHFEAEYYYKTYQNNIYDPTHGYFAIVCYDINVSEDKILKRIKPVLRYDMMSDNYNFNVYGDVINDVERSRITGGFTFSLDKPYLNDIRLNYEQYFYPDGFDNCDNKIVLEFVVRF